MAERIIESLYEWWYEAPVGARSRTENVGPSLLPVECQQAAPPSAGTTLALSLAHCKLSPRGEANPDYGNESLQAIRLVPSAHHSTGESR